MTDVCLHICGGEGISHEEIFSKSGSISASLLILLFDLVYLVVNVHVWQISGKFLQPLHGFWTCGVVHFPPTPLPCYKCSTQHQPIPQGQR